MAGTTTDNITVKERLRREIWRDTQEFLRRGGAIVELETPRCQHRPVMTIGLELPLVVEH